MHKRKHSASNTLFLSAEHSQKIQKNETVDGLTKHAKVHICWWIEAARSQDNNPPPFATEEIYIYMYEVTLNQCILMRKQIYWKV